MSLHGRTVEQTATLPDGRNTVLDPDQETEAVELAREIARKLEAGEIEPTAGAIEPFADLLR